MIALRKRTQGALNGGTAPRAVNAIDARLGEQEPTHGENDSCAGRLPAVPEAKEKERLPKSFDELAAHLDQEFGRLVADVEQMTKDLREAEKQAEQLRHRLLGGRSF
jgi:hypothetical protein